MEIVAWVVRPGDASPSIEIVKAAFLEVYLNNNQLFYRPVSADDSGSDEKGGWSSALQQLILSGRQE
ncbi:MAG: hypothetical protein C5B46_04475 [Proteobacteria bacterium]|nr:MAG: hypothetical protein C5B46_04475 [Pseudomonadota bacterium]